ncbi:GNAT family N-acetyltransferase [Erysipelothrix sp. HDW6C]|uniref:GNAT family N-acetyltransferase n=1 Tax=Erysipelothrix sp. HDW6C TaxID=2714930 RepID=UPI00140BA623|nr:GNAT family N-acetyltransferase [Erysipelothrix sp. HDW6C]QIK69417.1 GNAT family N-acetyltransferase [Erysipelothrix sp. HDW6C]
MITLKSLSGFSLETIHDAFVKAFSDYAVPMNPDIHAFKAMLLRRGFDKHVSVGAFADDLLVGFILNGSRLWTGKSTIYDLGTGVLPSYRRQGLTTRMFSFALTLFNHDQYLLEVLQSNTSAIALYEKQGFKVVRNFDCYQGKQDQIRCQDIVEVKRVESLNAVPLGMFTDCNYAWQNATDSVNAVVDIFHYYCAYDGSHVIGYGCVDPITGDVPQFAVSKEYRRRGIGTQLLKKLGAVSQTGVVKFINVDESVDSMRRFLDANGMHVFVKQFEMIRVL